MSLLQVKNVSKYFGSLVAVNARWPQLQHAVASHFGVSIRLGYRPSNLSTAAAVDGSGVRPPRCLVLG